MFNLATITVRSTENLQKQSFGRLTPLLLFVILFIFGIIYQNLLEPYTYKFLTFFTHSEFLMHFVTLSISKIACVLFVASLVTAPLLASAKRVLYIGETSYSDDGGQTEYTFFKVSVEGLSKYDIQCEYAYLDKTGKAYPYYGVDISQTKVGRAVSIRTLSDKDQQSRSASGLFSKHAHTFLAFDLGDDYVVTGLLVLSATQYKKMRKFTKGQSDSFPPRSAAKTLVMGQVQTYKILDMERYGTGEEYEDPTRRILCETQAK